MWGSRLWSAAFPRRRRAFRPAIRVAGGSGWSRQSAPETVGLIKLQNPACVGEDTYTHVE
jgi:hypothetical protein